MYCAHAAGSWFEFIVEIPKGSRNKYEIDHDTGALWLDRRALEPSKGTEIGHWDGRFAALDELEAARARYTPH